MSFHTIRKIYLAVVVPQMSYGCSVWYTPKGEKRHNHGHVKVLQSLQHRALKTISGAFQATSIPALDIETFILPISQRLEQIACEAAVRISCTTASDYITANRSTKTRRDKTPLEVLCLHVERKAGIHPNKLEKIQPYIVPPWWRPPKAQIAPTKLQAKSEHLQILQTPEPHRLRIYTDGSGINGKIGAAAVCDQKILRAYIGRADLYTVCYGELYGILMATSLTNLIINIEKQCNITTATIYTDNQAAIRKVQNPNNKSGQSLVQNIVIMIDGLRATGVEIDLRWVPAHLASLATKKQT